MSLYYCFFIPSIGSLLTTIYVCTYISTTVCPDLPNPANGMVTISGNSDGDTATYTCDQGYELVGAETLTCQSIGAQWSDPPPVCQLVGKKVIVPRM